MKPRCEGLLPVIGIGPMLTQVVLIQQFVLHRRELWRKLAREQTHIGALFQYHGVMHRIGGIFSPGERAVRMHQYRRDLCRVQPTLFEGFNDHFAGLVYGDFDGELIRESAKHGKVAVDVQCMLRHVEPDKTMAFHDWADKKEILPLIDYLKTDAAEAEILTGTNDRVKAAHMLHEWGAKEVMISHNTELLVYDGEKIYTCPIKARNLSGRTGRGDTAFAGYINERQHASVEEALLWATALVSLKMETPGPFRGCREDVEAYINEFYK